MSWPIRKLELLAADVPYAFVGGPFGSKLTTRDYVNEGVPVIRGSNLNNGRFLDIKDFVYVTEAKVRQDLFGNLAGPLDLIFTQRGTLGQVALVPEEGPYDRYVVSQSQMKLTVDITKADRLFLYYYFTSREAIQKILSYISSSGVPHINLTVLRNFEVPIPPLEKQQGIASLLSSYDNLIENNQRRTQLLEQAARLLYKEWFIHLRFPGHEHIKITDGVPERWDRTTIGASSSFLSRGITPKYNDEAPGLVINQKCIRHRMVNLDLARHQSKEPPSQKLVRFGDVFINSTGAGTLGRVAQYFYNLENCTVDSHVTIVRPSEGIPVHLFGMHLAGMESYIATLGRGATNQTELSRDSIAEIPILIPLASIGTMYEEIVSKLFCQIIVLIDQNTKLCEARDILLPRLMNGEIPV